MSPPDVVIPVRFGERNEELRYALRSLAGVPHGQVWLAGYTPTWVQGVRSIPTSQTRSKHENSLKNLLTACRNPGVSDEFYLWNDDFFLLRPVKQVEAMHRGPMVEMLQEYHGVGSRYVRGLKTTYDILTRLGVEVPYSYELHVPMLMCKDHVLLYHLEATAAGMPRTSALQIRSLYGNLCGVGGRRIADVKVWGLDGEERWGHEAPYVSTIDHLWGVHPASLEVMALYPEPGPYEKEKTRVWPRP